MESHDASNKPIISDSFGRPLWGEFKTLKLDLIFCLRARQIEECGLHALVMSDLKLARDIFLAAHLEGEFFLRSGKISDTYFDKYRFEGNPVLLRRVAKAMLKLLPPDTEVLAGLELGGVPIATAMSLESGLPAVFVRKEAKTYGTCLAVEGGDVQNKRVVLIEDVITTGGAVVDAANLVNAAGAKILAVVCAIWRGEGQPSILDAPEITLKPALSMNDLLRSAKPL